MSTMELSTNRPSSLWMGLSPISSGTSVPSLRRPKRSRPAPMARTSGAAKKAARCPGWASRKRSGTRRSTGSPISSRRG